MKAIRSVKDVIVIPTPEARIVSEILSSTVSLFWAPDSPESKINMSSMPIPAMNAYVTKLWMYTFD